MQYTGTLSAHHQNVTRNSNNKRNYAKVFSSHTDDAVSVHNDSLIATATSTHLTHRKCELSARSSSESDISTNVKIQLHNNNNNIKSKKIGKRRRKVQLTRYLATSTNGTCLLLVLLCLVVKLDYVIGAISLNSISSSSLLQSSPSHHHTYHKNVNYFNNSTNYTRTLLDDVDESDIPLSYFDEFNAIGNDTITTSPGRPQVIYQNEFAVHILGGIDKANEIARKHGFSNLGQVSS
jgi:hypothetical protein